MKGKRPNMGQNMNNLNAKRHRKVLKVHFCISLVPTISDIIPWDTSFNNNNATIRYECYEKEIPFPP